MYRRTSGFRFDGNAVLQLLDIRDDQLLPFLDAAADDVAVADQIADGDGLLLRHERASLPRLRHEHEVLAADPIDGHDRYRDGRLVRPDDARARSEEHTSELQSPD